MRKKESLRELSRNFISCHSEKNFNKLYERMNKGLLKYSYRITMNFEDAQDAVNITLSKVYKSIDMFKDPSKGELSSWIYRICKSESYRIISSKKHENILVKNPSEDFNINYYIDKKTSQLSDSWNSKEFCENNGHREFMQKNAIYDNFINISLQEMKNLTDKKAEICLKEKYINGMFIKDIANKYNFKNVNSIIASGKKELRKNIIRKYPDMYNIFFEETNNNLKKVYKLPRKILVCKKYDINKI